MNRLDPSREGRRAAAAARSRLRDEHLIARIVSKRLAAEFSEPGSSERSGEPVVPPSLTRVIVGLALDVLSEQVPHTAINVIARRRLVPHITDGGPPVARPSRVVIERGMDQVIKRLRGKATIRLAAAMGKQMANQMAPPMAKKMAAKMAKPLADQMVADLVAAGLVGRRRRRRRRGGLGPPKGFLTDAELAALISLRQAVAFGLNGGAAATALDNAIKNGRP